MGATAAGEPRRPLFMRAALAGVDLSARVVRHTALRMKTARKGLYYRMRGSDVGARLIDAAAFARAPREVSRRRGVAQGFNSRVASGVMDPAGGYGRLASDHFPDMGPVVATCRSIFEQKVAIAERVAAGADSSPAPPASGLAAKRRFLRNLLTSEDLKAHPALVDFALSDAALGIATDYLRTVPYLCRVDLLYSVPRDAQDNIASQLFHVDPEGLTQVKFFINIFDIDEAEGPFTFIPADESARILREIRALRRSQGEPSVGRYLDAEIAAVGGTDAIVTVKGPTGAGVAIDTSRCLHLGSRVQPGAFRLCLYVQYCTTKEPSNAFDIDRYANDPVRYMAVAHSLKTAGADVMAPHQMA